MNPFLIPLVVLSVLQVSIPSMAVIVSPVPWVSIPLSLLPVPVLPVGPVWKCYSIKQAVFNALPVPSLMIIPPANPAPLEAFPIHQEQPNALNVSVDQSPIFCVLNVTSAQRDHTPPLLVNVNSAQRTNTHQWMVRAFAIHAAPAQK